MGERLGETRQRRPRAPAGAAEARLAGARPAHPLLQAQRRYGNQAALRAAARRLRRQEAAETPETTEPAPPAGRPEALAALQECDDALHDFVFRYQNLLTHNMALLLADVLVADDKAQGISTVKGLLSGAGREAIGNLAAIAPAALARSAGMQVGRIFLGISRARIVGGPVAFVVGAFVEALVSDLLDRTEELIRSTTAQLDRIVTSVINPVAERYRRDVRESIRALRAEAEHSEMAGWEWQQLISDIRNVTAEAKASAPDASDERLYRHMALMAGVFSGHEVPAEDQPPPGASLATLDFSFTMQHALVDTGTTSVIVVGDGAMVAISCEALDCISDDGEYGPVDATGPGAAPSWKVLPPPRQYWIELYQPGLVLESAAGVPRRFEVGKRQHAVWYGVKRGHYRIRISRGDYHPVALCGKGTYSVSVPRP